MKSINPSTGEQIATFKPLNGLEMKQSLSRAEEAWSDWRRRSLEERSVSLRKIAALLHERVAELAELMTREMGKPIVEAEAEIDKCAWVCEYYADHGGEFLAHQPVETPARRSFVRFDPIGGVLAIMPWNFPFWQVFRFAAPALMAGNVVLMKHAPNTLGCAAAIERLCLDAGLPEGVLTDLRVPVEAIEEVMSHPVVAGVTITGSERAGRAVAALAGQRLKRTVLELGGSDPFIVLADADLEVAVAQGVKARTYNSGQSCVSAKRFIIEASIFNEFRDRFVEGMDALRVGDPLDRETQVGPIARADLMITIGRQVRKSVDAGAKLLTGGERVKRQGYFYAPTVLDDVPRGCPAHDEELFGPVASLFRVEDIEEAIALANSSRYGLGASIWTADLERGEKLAGRLDVGGVFVNRFPLSDPRLPFGGVKDSGYGRELGPWGIREFVNVKTVWVD